MENSAENLSLGGNVWNLAEVDERQIELLCQRRGLSVQMAKLLLLRHIAENDIDCFLNPKL